ncbi:MAG: hypothetical protein AAF750_08870 [Planctomycetota bacterium]
MGLSPCSLVIAAKVFGEVAMTLAASLTLSSIGSINSAIALPPPSSA